MIQTKQLNIGTTLEVASLNQMMFFGDIFSKHQQPLAVGEQYEVTKIKKSSPITIYLKQINGAKEGEIFMSFINNDMKIVAQPELAPKEEHTDPNTLADNEEFILVKKGDPTQFYKDFEYNTDDRYVQTDKDALIFDKKIGQRKKIKNKLALTGMLNMMSGMYNSNYWYFYFQQSTDTNKEEQKHHLSVFDETPYWFQCRQIINIESLKNLELRKYNKDTRKVSDNVIEFDCHKYVVNFIEKTQHIRLFGIGVASVVYELQENNKTEEYPYLFSSKFDRTKFKYEDTPQERDIYFDLALKALKLKKKDVIHYNNKGYTCVAFKTEEDRQKFVDNYKNTEKNVTFYTTDEILNSTKPKAKMKP
jgi:hypothetical protein